MTSIAVKAVRGAAWNMVTGVGSRVVGMIGTLLLTRFIVPEEMGEVYAAQICLATSTTFVNFAFGQSIIARNASPKVCWHAFVYHVSLGILAMSVALMLGPWLAPRLDAEGMVRYMPGFALASLFDRISYVPERTLVRDLHFRTVAMWRGIAELVFVAVALGLAGRVGPMAIIYGNIARWGLVMVMYVARSDRKQWLVPTKLDWASTRELFAFGAPLTIGFVAEFASTKWDNLMVSRYFGASVMGLYQLAYSLAVTPTVNVAEHIGDVLLPSFAKMSAAQRKDALVRSAAIMALIVFPLAVGLASVAPTATFTLLAGDWEDLAPMLVILCSLSLTGPLVWSVQAYLQAQQRPRAIMVLAIGKLLLMLLLIRVLGSLGPRWTCGAVSLAFGAHFFGLLFAVRLLDGVSMLRYLLAIAPPALACVPMFVVVTLVRWFFAARGWIEGWGILALLIGVGAVMYLVGVAVFARPLAREVFRLLRQAR